MIKIGIIDSGINQVYAGELPAVQGIFLEKDKLTNQICSFDNIFDRIGHGSECFRIISSIVTGANYYIVKIFDQEMIADVDILAAAIQTCINQNVNIINISAGVIADKIPELLRIVCDQAYENNIAIISAKHQSGTHCYPAHYRKVISVGTTTLPEGELYNYSYKENIEFYTSAVDLFPDDITWSDSTSFSCAKMTAYAANILKLKGHMKMENLTDELINNVKQ
ncbi:hypothetical protein HDF26_002212 [Pedobacter cryoconitis]|uniref:Peptidase S8/S53 domain-containing protein n=1 Tax=Pedobacter cryoconitis TaxID=188932 RepID=A0A7W9DXN4_9SPHI|nr:S8 family serine peptidase [Pedobacter cryoconitis]MBB5635061.1 hypothetical protein [Pedobacter cryoconitis]MBB6271755.1 hypothetical protein [Pedobacter cryoconitis]